MKTSPFLRQSPSFRAATLAEIIAHFLVKARLGMNMPNGNYVIGQIEGLDLQCDIARLFEHSDPVELVAKTAEAKVGRTGTYLIPFEIRFPGVNKMARVTLGHQPKFE
jgi:hypothetical protein